MKTSTRRDPKLTTARDRPIDRSTGGRLVNKHRSVLFFFVAFLHFLFNYFLGLRLSFVGIGVLLCRHFAISASAAVANSDFVVVHGYFPKLCVHLEVFFDDGAVFGFGFGFGFGFIR